MNTSVASVSASGLITAVGVGSTTITVSGQTSRVEATVAVTVTAAAPDTVTVTPTSAPLEVGDTQQLSVQFSNGSDTAAFASMNTGVATVNATGLITAIGVGSTTITVTGQSTGVQATVAVTVTAPGVDTITVTPTTAPLEIGDTQQLSVQFSNGSDTAAFASMDTGVATVNASGLITAIGVGSTTITVTGQSSGVQATVAVTVTAPVVDTITVTPTTAPLVIGDTQQLTVQFSNVSDTAAFASMNTGVATVSASGLITAIGVGSTTVTVTGQTSGVQATVAVTVTAPAVDSGTVSGFVGDTLGVALPGVAVTLTTPTLKGVFSTFTDAIGFYQFDSIAVQDGLVLCLQRDGFTSNCQTVDVMNGEVSSANATLKALSPATMIDPTTDAGVTDSEFTSLVRIPANALVDDAGNPPVGMVSVSLTVLSTDSPADLVAFPGNYMAISSTKGGVVVQLETFGLADVRATDENGTSLTLANGMSANLEIQLAQDTLLVDGDVVPLWSFDEASGMWIEEGVGTVIPSTLEGLVFTAEIDHFSWWNCDKPIETKHCLSGRIVDGQGNPLVGAHVRIAGVSYSGCSMATTDINGEYCVDVKRDSIVDVFATPAFSSAEFELLTGIAVSPQTATCETSPEICSKLGDLTISLDACISGTLIGRDGLPEPGIVVHSSVGTSDTTDANGAFCLGAPPNSPVNVFAVGRPAVLVNTDGAGDCMSGNCAEVTLDVPELRAGDFVGSINIQVERIENAVPFKGPFAADLWSIDTYAFFSLIDVSLEPTIGATKGTGGIPLEGCIFIEFDDSGTTLPNGEIDFIVAPLDPGAPGEVSAEVTPLSQGIQSARMLRLFDIEGGEDVFLDPTLSGLGYGTFVQEDSQFLATPNLPILDRLIESTTPITSADISWPGGLDIGPFALSVAIPEPLLVTAPFDSSTSSGSFGLGSMMDEVNVAQDLQVSWAPPSTGTATAEVFISFTAILTTFTPDFSSSTTVGGTVVCRAIDDGEFTVSSSFLSQLPSAPEVPVIKQTSTVFYTQTALVTRSIVTAEVDVPLVQVNGNGLVTVSATSNLAFGSYSFPELKGTR